MKQSAEHDHDDLLLWAEREMDVKSRGRLKIFLGAAPGVGKTYAMLQAARERIDEGVDVVVGSVDTHGRIETGALLEGLKSLGSREVVHEGVVLRELDLDGALARRPALLLVDDLSHTNAPGSRHARRYQDVAELLRAGIDVYTTLNVQHLESLTDLVTRITGLEVLQTVPDSILESADEVELIDLPPDDLLLRLREGKVFLPRQADREVIEFFRKTNLIALRDLALQCTADRVESQLQVYRKAEGADGTWPVTEKILVCIGPDPSAVHVVRAGRRLARRLRAGWTVLFVEEPGRTALGSPAREFAAQALRLSEQLGGEAVTLSARDPIEEIVAYARSHNVSKIVIGKPAQPRRMGNFLSASFVARLVRRSGDIDVFTVHGERRADGPPARRRGRVHWTQFALFRGDGSSAPWSRA